MKHYTGCEYIKSTGIIKLMFSNGTESVAFRIARGRTYITKRGTRCWHKTGTPHLYNSNMTLFMKDESIRPCIDVINIAIAQGCDELRVRIWTPIRKGVGREYKGYYCISMAKIVANWADRLTQHLTNPIEQQVKIDLDEMDVL